MKDSINTFLMLSERNSKYDPFYEEHSSKELFNRMNDEITEAIEELENNNHSELESELGDVIWDFFMLLHKLEDEGKIESKKVFDKINDKISKRKSFLLSQEKVTKAQAQEIRNNAKRQEGYDEQRLWNE